jgi:enterochelin esterase family protein
LHVVPNLASRENWVEVPGDRLEPWDLAAVPHGELHRHLYTSKAIKGLTAGQEPYLVYTPPGYNPQAAKPYPVLYLLHGWSETEEGWVANMNADRILDNLLAEGKIKPMVVVMPLGYGDMNFTRSFDVWSHRPEIDHNTSLFSNALLTEILPAVEREYHVATDREHRAIAGLSMGGLEALTIGLEHTGQFAWVGGFSSAVHALPYPDPLPGLDAKKADLRLLWIGCGLNDGLLEPNRKLETYLQGIGLQMTVSEIPGAHVAEVWRENLIAFAPLLFR